MKAIYDFFKSKKYLALLTLALIVIYTLIDFTYFNELVHSVIKGGVLFLSAGIFRNTFFRRTLGKYIESGQVHKDFDGDLSKEGDENLSKEELEIAKSHRATQAAERLKTYRIFTVTSLVVIALILTNA